MTLLDPQNYRPKQNQVVEGIVVGHHRRTWCPVVKSHVVVSPPTVDLSTVVVGQLQLLAVVVHSLKLTEST